MSRTYKDRPYRIRFPENYPFLDDYERIEYTAISSYYGLNDEGDIGFFTREYTAVTCLKKPGIKTKKRKTDNNEWQWMSTPGWWIRCQMTRPQRRNSRVWERKVLTQVDLEEADPPLLGRKPHIYYW